jgi:aerobic-type carbon monoxide dehydrogenase small subunit (CoxS/CutS family)
LEKNPGKSTGGSTVNIEISVNGELFHEIVSPDKRLLDFLREDLGYIGTKKGCDQGECGACSVIVNDTLVNSCMVLMAQLPEKSQVITIESNMPYVSSLKTSFVEYGAIQCGACTPGMILASTALLLNNPNPSRNEIRVGLSGVLCRCGGYPKIIEAVEAVRDNFRGGP